MILRKVGHIAFVLWGVVTLIFFGLRLVPGDPVKVIAPTASPEVQAQISHQLGLDDAVIVQYLRFLRDMLTGNYGESYYFQGSAFGQVMHALPYTALVAGLAMGMALAVAYPLGITAAVRRNRWPDRTVLGMSVVLQSAPNFWVALVLLAVVSGRLKLLPAVGFVGIQSAFLPALALSLSLMAILSQVVRNSMSDVLRSFMAGAMNARGMSVSRIVTGHGLRLTTVSIMTVVGAQFGYLLGGVVIVEYIFNYPGLGLLTLNAVLRRDYPLLQVISLVTAGVFLGINLLLDLSFPFVDPRLVERGRPSKKKTRRGRGGTIRGQGAPS